MKKIIALIIAGLMVLSFAACGEDKADETTTAADETTTAGADETTTASEGEETTDSEEETTDAEAGAPVKVEGSVSEAYVAAFKELAADGSLTAFEVVEKIAEKIEAPMMLMPTDMTEMMEEEDSYLPGFGEYKVEGFEEVVNYAPMMSSIPFISYVFKLSDDADKEAFATSLEENADPRWQMCVTADEKVVEVEGNFVFLIMCPAEFQYDAPDAGIDELA